MEEAPLFSCRLLTLDDVPYLLDWYNDPVLHETANSKPHKLYTLDELLSYWKNKLRREHCRYFAITREERLIGRVGLKRFPPHLEVVEYSVMIGPSELYNRGIGTAVTKEMIDTAFADPKVRIVRLFVRKDNKRALRCYEKSGYRLVHSFTQNGIPTDMMQIERSDWQQRKQTREEGETA